MSEPYGIVVVSAVNGLRAHVRLTLDHERFSVREAHDVATASSLVTEHQPVIVVLDANLADNGALALTRSLGSQSETEHVRTLLLVHRSRVVAGETFEGDAHVLVPATSFALLHEIDGLLPD